MSSSVGGIKAGGVRGRIYGLWPSMKSDPWMDHIWRNVLVVVAVFAAFAWLFVRHLVTGTWFVDAAHNSSDWLRGRIIDQEFWVAEVFVIWLITSLVAARVLALFVSPIAESRLGETGTRVLAGLGLFLILAGVAVWTLIGTVDPVPSFADLVLPTVAAVGIGIIVRSIALGHRLRLQVDVTGSDGKPAPVKTEFVVARMEALGTSRPRGLEFPHGTDVANLPEAALTTAGTTESKIVSALVSVFRSLAFVIPWRAEVAIVDKETAAVTLRRNGRTFDSQLISASALLPASSKNVAADDDKVLLTASAAFLLVSLSKVYPFLTEGMSGARNWRGVAAQVLATTAPWSEDTRASTELLAMAVDEDPHNLAAWLSYVAKRTGLYGSPLTHEWELDMLDAIRRELNDLDPGHRTEIALNLRLLRALTISATNLRSQLQSAYDHDDWEAQQVRQRRSRAAAGRALEYASLLIDQIEDASSRRQAWGLEEYMRRFRPSAASLYLHVLNLQEEPPRDPLSEQRRLWAEKWIWDPKNPDAEPQEVPEDEMFYLSSLHFHYSRACSLLEEEGDSLEGDGDKLIRPLRHLDLALSLPELRKSAESDPSLQRVRLSAQFAAVVDKRVRIASITALRSFSEKLEPEGLIFASDVTALGPDEKIFAKSETMSDRSAKWLRGICELAVYCPDPELAAEWTNFLTEEGIYNGKSLARLVEGLGKSEATSEVSWARINRSAEVESVVPPSRTQLREWVRNLANAQAAYDGSLHAIQQFSRITLFQ